MDRRDFLIGSAGSVVLAGLPACTAESGAEPTLPERFRPASPIIDTNAYLFEWPFRSLPKTQPDALLDRLQAQGVEEAWVGSFQGLLHHSLDAVNAQLARVCREHGGGFFVPFGSVNPRLPEWRKNLRRCAEVYNMPGIRVQPAYHNYTLADPVFRDLLEEADRHDLIVQVAPWLEDRRLHHPSMAISPVDVQPLMDLLKDGIEVPIILQNSMRSPNDIPAEALSAYPNVYYDFSRMDHYYAVARLLELVPLEQVLFGSYAPMLNVEASILNMHESELSPEQVRAICLQNPRSLVDGRG